VTLFRLWVRGIRMALFRELSSFEFGFNWSTLFLVSVVISNSNRLLILLCTLSSLTICLTSTSSTSSTCSISSISSTSSISSISSIFYFSEDVRFKCKRGFFCSNADVNALIPTSDFNSFILHWFWFSSIFSSFSF